MVTGSSELLQPYRRQYVDVLRAINYEVNYRSKVWLNYRMIDWKQRPQVTDCAVDYFGPFVIREGRKDLKRCGVLFTCMASRAVHVEVAATLETDSFINAFRRFVSRIGPIRQ